MVQVIQANPTFGTLLAQHLGQALGDLGHGFMQGRQKRAQGQGISTLLQQYGIAPEEADVISRSGLEAKDVLAQGDKFIKRQQEQQHAKQEEKQIDEDIQMLRQGVKSTGIPIFSSWRALLGKIPGTEAFEERKRFDATSIWLTDAAFQKINKGTLSKERQKLLIEKLTPNSELTQGENNARIDSLERIVKSGKPLDDSEADQILKGLKSGKSERPPLESFYK